jgi:hypothetical protein
MAPIFATTAIASSLPDEVNYEPYKRSYEQASDQLEIISRDLNEAKLDLQNAYDSENSYYSEIQNLEQENIQINSTISGLQNERYDLDTNIDQLDQKIRQLRKRIKNLERNKTQIQRDIKVEHRRLEPFRIKIQANKKVLKVAKVQLEKSSKAAKVSKKNRDAIIKRIDTEKKTLKRLQASLKAQKARLISIDAQITTATTKVTTITKKKAAAVKAQTAATQKLAALRAEAAALQVKIREIISTTPGGPRAAMRNPEYQAVIKQLRAKNVEIKAQAVVEKNTKTVTVNTQKQLRQATVTKNNLVNQKAKLPAAIVASKAAVKNSKLKVSNAEASFAAAEVAYQSAAAAVKADQISVKTSSAKVTKLQNKLEVEAKEIKMLRQELNDTEEKIDRVSLKLRNRTTNYNNSIDRISQIDRAIPNMRSDYRRNTIEVRRMNTSLVVIQDTIIQLNSDVTSLNSEESRAETSKDLKYQEYISRYEYHSDKLAEAKMIGASQSDSAISIANTDSNAYMEQRSSVLGAQIGEELANAQSNLWAAVRAEIKGYNDGYDSGYSSEEDEQRGNAEGTRAGINAAQDFANTVLKPQFFNADYSEALKGSTKELVSAISKAFIKNNVEFSNENINRFAEAVLGINPISNSEMNESSDTNTDLDSSIISFKKNLSKIVAQKSSYAQPGNVYQKPQDIPYEGVDCVGVYKGVSEYITACEKEYSVQFESKYLNEFRDNFNAQYTSNYQAKLENKRSQTISSIYQEDFERFYPIAQASGISDGKAQIFKEAYAVAKDNAYSNELPKATSVAKATAANEVRTWISNNAAVTVTGSQIEGKNLQGGSSSTVSLELKNISPKELSKPIKVIITRTRNASVENKTIYVKQAQGSSVTKFAGINFKVSSTARSNETISIEGRVILPGGKYEAERVESFKVSSVAILNPKIDSDVTFDSTPKIKGWRSYYIHKIDAEVSAVVEDIPAGYTINLVPSEESKEFIQITNTSEVTGSLMQGEKKEVTFKYRLKKKADGKKLNLELRYSYKGKVLRVNSLELRPH